MAKKLNEEKVREQVEELRDVVDSLFTKMVKRATEPEKVEGVWDEMRRLEVVLTFLEIECDF
jgi:hypothetical protein